MNLNYVYKEKYSIKVGYAGNLRIPRSQPEDFQSGLFDVVLLNLTKPFDQLETYKVCVGKIYKLNSSGTIRLNASVGLGYNIIREPTNWTKVGNIYIFQNYSWEYNTYTTASIIINPKIEFPLTRFYGLTVSPLIILNKDRSYYGMGIGQMIGLLRKKTDNELKAKRFK